VSDPLINSLHDWLWALLNALRSLLEMAPRIAVFTILSLVFAGLALAISRQHAEHAEKEEKPKHNP
jgi:hypothetical protein